MFFKQEYRVVAALDTETVNSAELRASLPVCWQIGYNGGTRPENTNLDSLSVEIARSYDELYTALSGIARNGAKGRYAPVIMVHNLSYDLHFLMAFIDDMVQGGYSVQCCFKSSIKPLNIKLVDSGGACRLCFWDTLAFSGMGLARMGRQCSYDKAVGDWDYSKTRNLDTPLTDKELHYARTDIEVMFAWLKFYLKLNPEIDSKELGNHILTKTSVVRYKCRENAKGLVYMNEKGKKFRVYQSFLALCDSQLPKTEEEYNLTIKSTSAGWTFTAGKAAGIAFENVKKYDARSMHPSHMLSHYYPVDFEPLTDPEKRRYVFEKCINTTLKQVLDNWAQPFEFAFAVRVKFQGLRLRRGSVYERDRIALHGKGLFDDYKIRDLQFADDESSIEEVNRINARGFNNQVEGGLIEFGKVVEADSVILTLNELNAWVHSRVYEWDSYEILSMIASATYIKPPDYVTKSVATMLERKSVIKNILKGKDKSKREWIPESAYKALISDPDGAEAKAYYMSVKSDLNSLYGMFATNEAKRTISYIPSDNTFDYTSAAGMENLPKNPKAWYQFGLRVAAWSRVQQASAIELLNPITRTYINGDTDSLAIETIAGFDEISTALEPLHSAIKHAMRFVTSRSKIDESLIDGLGAYEIDSIPDRYCAVANKRYAYTSNGNTVLHVASAGVPTANVKKCIELELNERDFATSVIRALGYNVTYIGELSGFKAQVKPEWADRLEHDFAIVDYNGDAHTYKQGEPIGTYLYETDKILGYGYDRDHIICCENARIEPQPMHFYELTIDGNVKGW